jgi:hypothetical protein
MFLNLIQGEAESFWPKKFGDIGTFGDMGTRTKCSFKNGKHIGIQNDFLNWIFSYYKLYIE